MRHRLPQFNHLFTSDSYSAGYYSYLWSDVMASDAWAAFEDTGSPWDPTVAQKFKSIILATGNSIDRAEAYRRFRGREPDVDALLKNRGFPVAARREQQGAGPVARATADGECVVTSTTVRDQQLT